MSDTKTLMRKGKVKEAYDLHDGTLEFVFTDNVSVFDKVIPTTIDHKGEVLCRISAFWFQRCEDLGVNTHFISAEGNRMRVNKFDIITDYDRLDEKSTGCMIPLEVIARYYVAGSLYERFKDQGMDYGDELPEPIVEFTTKFEEYDRKLTEEEAMDIASLSRDELEHVKETVLAIDRHMNETVQKRGLIHVDGKKEFAFDDQRNLVLVDTFGTPDEDRFWDADKYRQGVFEERSKEFVRAHYRDSGYYDRLKKARERDEEEPEIPPLPDNVAREASQLYIDIYEQITGDSF
ncbi:MAG: phosphoribosylaminoimidazolesuccinocarboxamide synthase [Candidatus Thermoplasmatota archaeon]|nr:phosphoribosylaminoimidazolesuccinocarboxamide synthase [Candidatus Thermoplasmatota archaeon]